MKKYATLPLTACLLLFLATCSQNKNAVTIAPKMPVGTKFFYNINIDMGMKQSVNGNDIDVTSKVDYGYTFTVTGEIGGSRTISATVSKIMMDVTLGNTGVSENYDSDSPTKDTGKLARILSTVIGEGFSFVVNSAGEMLDVKGMQLMIKNANAKLHGADSLMAMKVLYKGFNDASFTAQLQQTFAAYNLKPVAPGDKWTKTVTDNSSRLPMSLATTYTLDSVAGGIAHITVNAVASNASGPSGAVKTTGNVTGKMLVEVATGIPVSLNTDMNVDMQASAQGQSVTSKTKLKTLVNAKKL